MVNSHWESAVTGLQYLKEGLECFCDYVVNQQHARLIEICPEACTECDIETLIPDHSYTTENNKKRCPLSQIRCNCLKVNDSNQDLKKCPKETCGIIYDEIIKNHGSTPPSPNWNNTDITKWYTDPWAVATCFIKARGYADRKSAQEFDCSGLLSIIVNNKVFLSHLDCDINGDDAFSKAIEIRNELFHSPTMEIGKEQANKYIDNMIAVLKDKKELLDRNESRDAVQRLEALKKNKDCQIELDYEEINDVLRKTETDPNIAIQYIKQLLSEGLKSMYKDRDEKVPEDSALSHLLTKIQKDRTDTIEWLTQCCWEILHNITDIKKRIGIQVEKTAEDSELLHAVQDEIQNDQTNALRLLTACVGKLSSDVKQLQMKVGLETAEAPKKYEMPTIDRPHDGRLITLSRDELNGLLYDCESGGARKGGFGEVYVSKNTVPGLGIRVAIKKVDCQEKQKDYVKKMRSTSNEKIASRVMHFAIVPLIAYMDEELGQNNRAFYFLSPFLERGNLLELIAHDKQSKEEDIQLKRYKRIEILFQIASALDFLHTPVPKTRGKILHVDLTSTNIVLDNAYNARVIDFGLAREMKEAQNEIKTQSTRLGTPGYYTTQSYSSLTVHEDYFNYGVVVREVVTGEPPEQKHGNVYSQLKRFDEDFLIKRIQRNIWKGDSGNALALTLAKLSSNCLNSKEKRFCSVDILETLKDLRTRRTDFTGPNEKMCHTCMVNEAVEGVHSPQHNCGVKVCVSCMRNSHMNPIKCPLCNECVVPKIGHTFAALLIAGNDLKNGELAKSFKDDVEEINKVLVSTYPCVVGIRKENVRVVTPSDPGKPEKLLPRLSEAMDYLTSEEDLETLLLYFTGHHSMESGFTLGGDSEDILTVQKLQEDLKKLSQEWGKETRILVFLDCCYPPSVEVSIPELSNEYVQMIQVNACRPEEPSRQPINGSNFQKFFIQALTRRSFSKRCHNNISDYGVQGKEMECPDCKMSGDFITVERLLEYISEHMGKSWSGNQPVMNTHNITWLRASIGYNVDFDVNLEIKFEGPNQKRDVCFPQQIFYDIEKLKESVLENLIADGKQQLQVKLTPVEFSDAIALQIHTGSQSQGGHELCSMSNVASAMNGKREIFASYRPVSNILVGRVVLFDHTDNIFQYLERNRKGSLKNTDEGRKIATLSFDDLDRVTNDSTKMESSIHTDLLEVERIWRNKKNKENKELKIIFPCLKDDKFHDFMVLDLHDKPGN